jgi:succinyl-CoA synthetase beta subunit
MMDTINEIISNAAVKYGWVMEPEAKEILSLADIPVPRFLWAKSVAEACSFATTIGYPVVMKIVSPQVMHKSESGGVVVGVADSDALAGHYRKWETRKGFSGVLIEEMIGGLELIIGSKIDCQFGPVILLGIGGTGVEIYQDATIRMAPLHESDVRQMVKKLKAHSLLEGFRGAAAINMEKLTALLLAFSRLTMELESRIESIDLNPVFCSSTRCLVGDARILLARQGGFMHRVEIDV